MIFENDKIRVYYNKVLADKYLQSIKDENMSNLVKVFYDYFSNKGL